MAQEYRGWRELRERHDSAYTSNRMEEEEEGVKNEGERINIQ